MNTWNTIRRGSKITLVKDTQRRIYHRRNSAGGLI